MKVQKHTKSKSNSDQMGKKFFAKIIIALLFTAVLSFLSRNDSVFNIQSKPLNGNVVTSSEAVLSATTSAASFPKPLSTVTPAHNLPGETLGNTTSGFCLKAPVLLYHHVEPMEIAIKEGRLNLTVDNKIFEEQMNYLVSAGYQTISADQLVEALLNHKDLPPKSILLTFDDGYQDFYTYVYPTIQKYRLIVNLMIPTGLMENKGYLTWLQLKEMAASGLVFNYNHTWSHASLAGLPEEKIQSEISTAQKQLGENLGKTSTVFFYPYGATNAQVIDILRKNGFTAAFSTGHGFTQCDSFIMNLHRNHVGNTSLQSYGF